VDRARVGWDPPRCAIRNEPPAQGDQVAKPYDATAKELLERDPESWLRYIGVPAERAARSIDADLSTLTAEADKVFRIDSSEPYLVHVEIQASPDATIARRLLRYNALLDVRHDLRVLSAVVLLRPRADPHSLPGVLDLRLPGGDRVVEFHYKVIRAWQQPVEPILAGGVGTLPLAPLADLPDDAVPAVIDRIGHRVIAETPHETAVTIMESTLLLAGLRFGEETIKAFRRRLETMSIAEESSYPRVLIKEGRVKQTQSNILRLGGTRFGPPDDATKAAIESTEELDRLERLLDRILTASSWGELLAEP
jgi:hypothetical protein